MMHDIDKTPTTRGVPIRSMTTALVVAQRLAGFLTREHLLQIARGDPGLAHSIERRLGLIATLLESDPSIRKVVSQLTARQIADVLSAIPLPASGSTVQTNPDELAAGLRLAAWHTSNP